jgi:ABC-type nitrate/sulfonate/bicarbonate transport system substrate-binding protein
MNMIWLVTFLISVLPILTGVPAHATAAPFKLVVGYAALNSRVSPLWIAEERGFFAKYGIDAQPIYIRGAPTLVAGLSSGDIQIGRSGGSATLAAVGAGRDFKIVATFSSHNTYDLVTQSNIRRPEDLRGKIFGLTSIGGTTWMGALLWLEHLGLDQQRDHILFQVIGDQTVQAQAIESGTIDAAVLDGVFSRPLKQKGFNFLGEFSDLNQRLVGQAMVVPHAFLQQHADVLENYLKAEIEASAFAFGPKNKPAVLKILMSRLRVDAAAAEEGYQDLLRGVDRKPFPSLEGLRNTQRLMRIRNPKVGEVKVEDVLDNRIMRKLDDSGFIDRAYAAHGVSLK